jgi:glycosyltransferase involved in cell wall biosynthesis
MKLLYITPAWFGFDKMLFEGETKITGLPSFVYPLKGLIDKGYQVDMILIYTSDELPKINIQSEWVSKINIISYVKYELTTFKKIISILKFQKYINKVLKAKNYDFVYAHGSSPAVVRRVVVNKNIPFAQRLYGTFIWDKFKKKGHIYVAIKHVVEYLSFTTKKSFLIATNDGSGADKVVDKIFGKKTTPYEFYYWKNGVDRCDITKEEQSDFSSNMHNKKPFIFYCARFDEWKRQDRVIRILKLLKDEGVYLDVYFAGPFDTLGDHYYNYVCELASELEVIDQCHFLGSISKKEIFLYNKLAIASLCLHDVCNITSVFHEMMASGALMIVKKDDDTSTYITNRENGFLVDNDDQAASVIKEILEDSSVFQELRKNISNLSLEITQDWDSRVNQEIELIEKHSLSKNIV